MIDACEDFSRYGIVALTSSTKPMTSIEKLLCQCSVSPSMCIGDAIGVQLTLCLLMKSNETYR